MLRICYIMKKNTGSKKQDEIILKIKQGPIGRYNLTKQQTKQVTLFSCVRLSGISCSMYSMRRDSASRTYFWILPPSLSEEFYGFFLMLLEVLPFKLKIQNIASRQTTSSFRNVCMLLVGLQCSS